VPASSSSWPASTSAASANVAERTLGPGYAVRDYGLLEAAWPARGRSRSARTLIRTWTAKPRHSIARNYALIDGNKRLALAAVTAFYGLNGRRLTLTNDQAYDLVMSVAAGQLDTVDAIAAVLLRATQP
jgi:death-on-curing protein